MFNKVINFLSSLGPSSISSEGPSSYREVSDVDLSTIEQRQKISTLKEGFSDLEQLNAEVKILKSLTDNKDDPNLEDNIEHVVLGELEEAKEVEEKFDEEVIKEVERKKKIDDVMKKLESRKGKKPVEKSKESRLEQISDQSGKMVEKAQGFGGKAKQLHKKMAEAEQKDKDTMIKIVEGVEKELNKNIGSIAGDLKKLIKEF